MKKSAIFASILIVLGSFVITDIEVGQAEGRAFPCGSPVIEGCVGACGAPFLTSYRVLENGAYCFTRTESSLCPNTGAEVTIFVNAELRFKRDMTDGVLIVVGAQEGDVITIEANLFPIEGEEPCPFLGELYFILGRLGKTE